MEYHLKFIGIAFVLLALLHSIFPRYFDWNDDLKSLSLINRQMMQTHTFFIAITVFLMGILSFFYAKVLIDSRIGRHICIGLGIFWFLRLYFQLFVYSSLLWRGKRFETTIHILATFFWSYLTIVYIFIGLKY